MNHEIMMYGLAQKEQLGFDKAVEVRRSDRLVPYAPALTRLPH